MSRETTENLSSRNRFLFLKVLPPTLLGVADVQREARLGNVSHAIGLAPLVGDVGACFGPEAEAQQGPTGRFEGADSGECAAGGVVVR